MTTERLRSVAGDDDPEEVAAAVADETLEERVERLERTVDCLQQHLAYLQGRNHGLESAVAASAALLLSVTEGESARPRTESLLAEDSSLP